MIVLLDNDNIAEIIDNKVTRVMIDLADTCLLSSYNIAIGCQMIYSQAE